RHGGRHPGDAGGRHLGALPHHPRLDRAGEPQGNAAAGLSDVSVRIDKWLWAARFFKTRSAAQQAVEGGKIKLGGERSKPSKDVRIGDEIAIHIGAFEWTVRVEGLSDKRGSATVARVLYSENEA